MAAVHESTESIVQMRLGVSQRAIDDFCARWGLQEFSLFGSVVREDFNQSSDVDVLVRLDLSRPHGGWDWIDMIDELESLFGRKVDLVSANRLENPFFKKTVLSERRVLYAA